MSLVHLGCQTGRWSSKTPHYSNPPARDPAVKVYADRTAQRGYNKLRQAEMNAQRAYERRNAWRENYWCDVAMNIRRKLYPMPKIKMWSIDCSGTLASDLQLLESELWSAMGFPSNRSALAAQYESQLGSLRGRLNQLHGTRPSNSRSTSSSLQDSVCPSKPISLQDPGSVQTC